MSNAMYGRPVSVRLFLLLCYVSLDFVLTLCQIFFSSTSKSSVVKSVRSVECWGGGIMLRDVIECGF